MLAVISLLSSNNSRFADGINLATLRTKNHRPRKPCLWCWDKSNNQLPEFNRPWRKFHVKEVSRKERKGAKNAATSIPLWRSVQQLYTKMPGTQPLNSCIRGNYNLRICGNKHQHRISPTLVQVSRKDFTQKNTQRSKEHCDQRPLWNAACNSFTQRCKERSRLIRAFMAIFIICEICGNKHQHRISPTTVQVSRNDAKGISRKERAKEQRPLRLPPPCERSLQQ